MKKSGIVALVMLTGFAMLSAPGLAQCVPTSAPNGDLSVNLPDTTGAIEMIEERQICSDGSTFTDRSLATIQADGLGRKAGCGYDIDGDAVADSPIILHPGFGFIFGQGVWIYEETNGFPGIQAGGFGIVAEAPDCDTEIPLPPEAGGPLDTGCIIFNELIEDVVCAGTGLSDRLVFGAWVVAPAAAPPPPQAHDQDGDGENELIIFIPGNGDGVDDGFSTDTDGDGDIDTVVIEMQPK